MSRSALTRYNRQTNPENAAYDYSTASVAPTSYFIPPVYPQPGYVIPSIAPYPAGLPIPNQPYVPIRLTGDEDDIEDPNNRKSVLPQHGNSQFNINPLLYQNIMENDYFKALYAIKTYHEVLDEVRAVVMHVAPWATGTSRIPSSAFCLLLKLLLMKMTFKQMNGILNNKDNVFIKAIGLLYLRYSCPPTDLWKWFEPHIEDDREIVPSSDPALKMTVGAYAVKLLTDMSYYGTTLPRIPVPIERKIKVYLLLQEEKQKRRKANLKYQEKGLLVAGLKIKAIYR
jgi:pre-mRNA-splicing factor 38B